MANNTIPDEYQTNFIIIKEPTVPINFKAEALPRSYGFKVKWTKMEMRMMEDFPDYRIIIKIYEKKGKDDDNKSDRVAEIEPNYLLTQKIYKWDARKVDPNKQYIVEISLHYSLDKYSATGEAFAIYRLLNCQTYLTESQFHVLFVKATQFCNNQCGGQGRMIPITHFYKSEDDEYWNKNSNSNNGNFTGIFKLKAEKKKTHQGHRVPGIDRIPGISYFALPHEPNPSPFGKRYVAFPIECFMKNPLDYEFYFSDIRCYKDPNSFDCKRTHYITIVIAKRGSEEDIYCKKRLGPALIKTDNPFFCIKQDKSGNFAYFVPGVAVSKNWNYSKCFLEIFFAQKGHLTFDWQKVQCSDRYEKWGKVKVHYEECMTCSYTGDPFGFGSNPEMAIPRVQSFGPSKIKSPSYPSTPEPDEEQQENEDIQKSIGPNCQQNGGEVLIQPLPSNSSVQNTNNVPSSASSFSFRRGLSSFSRKRNYSASPYIPAARRKRSIGGIENQKWGS